MFTKKPLAVAVHRALSTVAIAATAVSVSTASHAQDQLQEVVVTGSRIATDPNLITSSPVTSVSPEEIEYRGITRVEDLLNDLPQVVPELTSNDSNGSTGTATLDLRGLGSDRTLVLTNGHRMGFGDVFALAPDINQVPSRLIQRVEVLTGGASSTYGSDAMSGVVNFIMKDDFEGVQIDYQYSAYQHDQGNNDVQDAIDARGFEQADNSVWDGGGDDISLIMGVNTADGRGNITGYIGYRNINAVLQSERDFSACALSSTNGVTCGGSATSAEGLFAPFDYATYFTVEGSNFVPGVPLYNYGPLNYFQRPDERYSAGMFGHYEVNEHADVYTEFQFMDDRSLAQIAPSGAFFVTSTLSCDNPLLSAQQTATINAQDNYAINPATGRVDLSTGPDGIPDYPCVPGNGDVVPFYVGRRNVEGGPRIDDLRHTSYRLLGGVRGDVTDDWSYDAFANFSRMIRGQTYQNDFSTTRLVRALDVVAGPGGAATCQSVIDGSDPSCVPYNIFTEGGVTQAAIDYLTLPLFADAEMKQEQLVGYVTGDLTSMGVVSPAATDGVKIVLGGEFRDEQMDFDPDQGFQTGDGAGQGGPVAPVNGQVQVTEFFMEMKVPFVQGREWIESLTGDFGYRYSDYDTDISTDTYKANGEWTPQEGVKFRGGYSRATRNGNLVELFQPSSLGLWSEGGDPCAGNAPELTQAQCALTGVPAGAYGFVSASPAGQYNGVFGGNPDLDPEKSNSFTIGAVFTPSDYVEGLQFSIDYWSIEVKDAIGFVEPNTIITQCGLTGDAALCGLIQRSPVNGNLWVGTSNFVTATNVNIGFFDVSGIDFVGGYSREVGNYGGLNLSFRGTWVEKWKQQEIPGGEIDNCVGLWGGVCSRPTPEWKHTFTSTWTTPWDLTFVGTWRMVAGMDEFSENDAAFDTKDEHYLDLAVSYTPQFIGIGETTLNMGVANVTDNDPPVNGRFGNVAVYGNGNTIGGTWDTLGRYFFFGVSQKF